MSLVEKFKSEFASRFNAARSAIIHKLGGATIPTITPRASVESASPATSPRGPKRLPKAAKAPKRAAPSRSGEQTPLQRQVLETLQAYYAKHHEHPTVPQLAKEMGLMGAAVAMALRAMALRGEIDWRAGQPAVLRDMPAPADQSDESPAVLAKRVGKAIQGLKRPSFAQVHDDAEVEDDEDDEDESDERQGDEDEGDDELDEEEGEELVAPPVSRSVERRVAAQFAPAAFQLVDKRGLIVTNEAGELEAFSDLTAASRALRSNPKAHVVVRVHDGVHMTHPRSSLPAELLPRSER